MSHVLRFWAFPIPKSLPEAARMAGELAAQSRGQNRMFLTLAQRLTARHPSSGGFAGDEARAVWSDAPPDGVTLRPIYSLGVLDHRVAEVLPFIVETATSLGLVVYDEPQSEVHLPGGITFGTEGQAVGKHLGMELDGPLCPALVERTLLRALEPLLAYQGFELNRVVGGLWRSTGQSTQLVRPQTIRSAEGLVAFDIEVLFTHNLVKPLVEQILALATGGEEKHVATATMSLASCFRFERIASRFIEARDGTEHFEVRTLDELRQCVAEIRSIVNRMRKGMLIGFDDVPSIEYNVNSRDVLNGWRSFAYTRLTPRSIASTIVMKTLLDTRHCGGSMVNVLLAHLASAPEIEEVITRAQEAVALLPASQQAREKAKLELAVMIARGAPR